MSNDQPLPPVICLMGPTCSGKTALAIALRQVLPVELVNVDSALVYAGLEIGAARPEPEVLAEAPHRLLGFRDPADPYSAALFREDALKEIADIHAAGRIPLLVGGTMLYFKALLDGLAPLPAADPEIRARINARAEQEGWPAIHAWLQQVDPVTAQRLKPNDRQRLQRALEIFLVSGEPMSVHLERQQVGEKSDVELSNTAIQAVAAFPYTAVNFAIAPTDRAILHQRIAERFRQMLDQGLVAEVESLYRRGDLHPALPAIRAVGYRQVWQYLDGELSYDEMVERGIIATRQLAKRQFTWLRGWSGLVWLDSDATDLVDQVIKELARQGVRVTG